MNHSMYRLKGKEIE